jgi:ubiquinone/menaquinone biosynthesis C-methylase UbiE
MSLRSVIVAHFRQPRGWIGRLVGWIMRTRPSNRQRNLWTVDLLDIQPGDRVLELGCGPGVALEACAARAVDGHVVGLDHSALMIAQAAKRLAAPVAEGRADLRVGTQEDIPALGGGFDKAYLVNVVQFLPDREAAYRMFFDVLAPGGTMATTYQPRHKNPTRADALAMADRIEAAMTAVGFTDIRIEELPLKPVAAVCVLGKRPA